MEIRCPNSYCPSGDVLPAMRRFEVLLEWVMVTGAGKTTQDGGDQHDAYAYGGQLWVRCEECSREFQIDWSS